MKRGSRTFLIWVSLVAVFVGLYSLQASEKESAPTPVSFSTFKAEFEADRFSRIWIAGRQITAEYSGSEKARITTTGIIDDDLYTEIEDKEIPVDWNNPEDGSKEVLSRVMGWAIPILLGLGAVLFFLRKASARSAGSWMSMRRSNAREASKTDYVTFADVGGCNEAKVLFADVIDFLKHSDRWTSVGARLPRGILLEGNPGCGKTLLARAVAGETKAKFYITSGSDFVEMFVGVGAARIRDTFETAAKNAPAVIFIDELDALGRRRGSGMGSAHAEHEQTLNQLLVCLDGFEKRDRVVVIAATNRPDILDAALLRPGRFDRRIRIADLSDSEQLEVLSIHTKNKPLSPDLSLASLHPLLCGMSGSDIEALSNEAILRAIRRVRSGQDKKVAITLADFKEAAQFLREHSRHISSLDALLVGSASQFLRPSRKVIVEITLQNGHKCEGEVLWADPKFLKIKGLDASSEILVPKAQISSLIALSDEKNVSEAEIQVRSLSDIQQDLA